MTWTKPGLVKVTREVGNAQLVSWGPCSDPLPHLAVGPPVELRNVENDIEAAQHVGKWIAAVGEGLLSNDRLVALNNVSIAVHEDPFNDMADDECLTLEQILASAPGPSESGAITLSEDELRAFLEAARG